MDIEVSEIIGDSPDNPAWDYDAIGYDAAGNLYHWRYGLAWPRKDNNSLIDLELFCFKTGRTAEEGGLGRFGHLQECIELLWNHGGKQRVEWNPWMETMLVECCGTYEADEFLAVAGCSSSSKSHTGAIWVWVNWLADPEHTLGLVTSTSIQAAKKRIFKSMVQLYRDLPPAQKKRVKHRPSLNMFQYLPADGSAASDASTISLIAAEPKQEAAAASKMIGLKNEIVILIGDELCELSPAILSAATDNLVSNPKFHMVAMSNPKDREDSFGQLCEPTAGWDSIDESTYEWRTKYGVAIRFDCLQSPNYIEQETVFKYMLTHSKIEKARELKGENSPSFYRFYRGFFPIQGAEDVLYNEVDFSTWLKNKIEWGNTPPIKVAALDPSFSSGGDLTMLTIGLYGKDVNGKSCIEAADFIPIKENAQDKQTPRTYQIWNQVKKHLDNHGIEYKNLAVDNTGGGGPFCDTGVLILSHEILRVEFGGKASDRPVAAKQWIEAHKKYCNRVSELWGVGMEFLRGGQYGINRGSKWAGALMGQMKARRYETVKSGDGERIRVESKKLMKARTGRSPDEADAWWLLTELCRQRHRFRSEERGISRLPEKDYTAIARKLDMVTRSNRGANDWQPAA